MIPLLSILTPSIPSRMDRLQRLMDELQRQIGDLPVEHLVLIDNKRRTVGEKREALLHAAKGDYIAFVDDDDWVRGNYVHALIQMLGEPAPPDVVTFQQHAYFEGVRHDIRFKHGHENEAPRTFEMATRGAWHVCCWRRSIALLSHFPSTNYGEDWAWAEPLNKLPLVEHHIPAVLHEYHYRSDVSEAQP